METVTGKPRHHSHYPRIPGVRTVFYMLLVAGVGMMLVYTSVLASFSVHITVTAAASRQPAARTRDPPSTRVVVAPPRSRQSITEDEWDSHVKLKSSNDEGDLVILEFEDFAAIDSKEQDIPPENTKELGISPPDTKQLESVDINDMGHQKEETKELDSIQAGAKVLDDKQAYAKALDDKKADTQMGSKVADTKEQGINVHPDEIESNIIPTSRLFIDTQPMEPGSKPKQTNVSASLPTHLDAADHVSKMAEPEVQQLVPVKSTNSKRWQKIVKNGNWIIYGAYYNRRPTAPVVKRPVDDPLGRLYEGHEPEGRYGDIEPTVQVIVSRKEKAKGHGRWPPAGLTFTCELLYPGDRAGFYTTARVQSTAFYLWSGHHNTKYRPGHICCKLPDSRLPEAVSITSGFTEEPPLNQVKINYEQLQESPRSFTLCLSPLHFTKNVDKTLVQYFELNKLLGADFFYVYNYKVSDKTQKVIDFYSKRNNTRVIPWHLPVYLRGDEDMWYFAQTIALNDCLLRSKGNTEYLVTTDLDEFILPRAPSSTWKEMIAKESDACTYNLKPVIVDMTKKVSVIKNDARKKIGQKFGLFTLLNQAKHTALVPGKVKSKYIVRPSCYDGLNVHTPMNMSNENGEEVLNYVTPENGVMYHYASPDANFIDETSRNDADIEKTVMRFATALIKRVAAVWKKLGHAKP